MYSGNPASGQAILAGYLPFEGQKQKFVSIEQFLECSDINYISYMHGFSWLADLREVKTEEAQALARKLVCEWMLLFNRWNEIAWHPAVIGERLVSWTTNFAFIATGTDAVLENSLLSELAKAARHLSRVYTLIEDLSGRVGAIQGLIYAGVSLSDSDEYIIKGLEALKKEQSLQFDSYGSHVSRNPTTHMRVLQYFVEIRETLSAARIKNPEWLVSEIEKMTVILRDLRMGDGCLAFFNGGTSGDSNRLTKLVSKTKVKRRQSIAHPNLGYQRITAGKTILIMDAGKPPENSENKWGHAGTLSFEMSAGTERLIVNCGMASHLGNHWREALRGTAAHSTATIDNLSTSPPVKTGGGVIVPTKDLQVSRRISNGKEVLEGVSETHGLYEDISHRRILAVETCGTNMYGEDQIIGKSDGFLALRFHLHPNVQATLIQSGQAVLLKLRRGRGWKFFSRELELKLEDSIYCNGYNRRRRSQQIVIRKKLIGERTLIRWGMKTI
ncbi:MAG: heparinase II/III family protein [Pseudomonadota bacterium]|nr:heparinase II/III family protein [Pseudomonadota bacterium]